MARIKDFYINELQSMASGVIHINLPKSYNDLSNWQLSKITKIVNQRWHKKTITLYVLIVLMLHKFSFKKYYKFFKFIRNVPLLDPVVQESISFVYDLGQLTKFPKKIRHRFCVLYGPKNRLGDISVEEFTLADLFYFQWMQDKTDDALNRLVSALYRPKNTEFKKTAMPEIAKCVQKIDKNTKLAIAYAFGGSRLEIEKQFPHVFPKNKNNTGSGKYVVFDVIARQFARQENKPLGDLYATRQSNIYDFLLLLNDEIKDMKELEKRMR